MKPRFALIILAVFVLLLVVMATTAGTYVVPYQPMNARLPMSAYEGFSLFGGNSTAVPGQPSNPGVAAAIKPAAGQVQQTPCKRVDGFDGIYCSADNVPKVPMDMFSDTPGDLKCQSYGYSNSRGFLCLSDTQKKLISSRGGNATGM
jgi:hypothetical protein